MGKSKWKVDGKRKKNRIRKVDISYCIQLQLQTLPRVIIKQNKKQMSDAGGFINGSLKQLTTRLPVNSHVEGRWGGR